MHKKALVLFTVIFILLASVAMAVAPYSYPTNGSNYTDYVYGVTSQRLAINSGPGTRRYFSEKGTYGSAGEWVRIYSKAWDPNNDIWWVKVEYPNGSGSFGWTGLKRFDKYSFDLDDVYTEYWY